MACLLSAVIGVLADGIMGKGPWSTETSPQPKVEAAAAAAAAATRQRLGADPMEAATEQLHRMHFASAAHTAPSSPPPPSQQQQQQQQQRLQEFEAARGKFDTSCSPERHLRPVARRVMPDRPDVRHDRSRECKEQPGSTLCSPSSTAATAAGESEDGGPNLKAKREKGKSEEAKHAVQALSHPTTTPLASGSPMATTNLLARRRRVMSKAQSVSYENTDPLFITRGHGQFLVDVEGRCFLDTRNNVCHVGHANAQVAKAASTQMATLNTNTRYLHPCVVALAEQLLATFPSPLRDGVVFFANSGSEANDLALRLARCYTGCTESIAVEHGYHGHTCAVIACSPYKCKHPRFREPTASSATHIVPAPDTYRLHPSVQKALEAARSGERRWYRDDLGEAQSMPVPLQHDVKTSDSGLLLRASSQSSNEDSAEERVRGRGTQLEAEAQAIGRGGQAETRQTENQELHGKEVGSGRVHGCGEKGRKQASSQDGAEGGSDSDSGHSSIAASTRSRQDTLTGECQSTVTCTTSPPLPPPPSLSVMSPDDEEALVGALYAEHVEAVARRRNGKLACMLVESGMSVAGVLLPPRGYLQRCFSAVRAAGGVCIVDEVQTGFGRLGSSYWAFQANSAGGAGHSESSSPCSNNSDTSALHASGNCTHGNDPHGDGGVDGTSNSGDEAAVPDMVTVGKPFGNGMPLAAVVCRRDIAAAFEQGPEYFNTFGGNPVCCAAGIAVMEEIRSLNLMGRATHVGRALRAALVRLQRRLQRAYTCGDMETVLSCECGDGAQTSTNASHVQGALTGQQGAGNFPQYSPHTQQPQPQQQQQQRPGLCFVGDVRGEGLFLGVDFVTDVDTRAPATRAASFICSHLKNEHKILTSLDGPGNNVMVIKPPMVFTLVDAHRLARALECAVHACWQLTPDQWDAIGATPT